MSIDKRESVARKSERGHYDWTVALPDGREIAGHADIPAGAS